MTDPAQDRLQPSAEMADARLKRLRMRSWRRGIREMDLILGSYADECLGALNEPDVALYDVLLSENDQDLYEWVTGRTAPPPHFETLILRIAEHASGPGG